MAILDPALIGEFAAIVTTSMQGIKAHPKIKGSVIPWLSAVVGIAIGLGWYLVAGDLRADGTILDINWQNVFRGIFNGIAGAIAANGAYNIQKFLPIPNILPTATELDTAKLKEEVVVQRQVVEAVKEGVDPVEAKEAVGLEPHDPPPAAQLEQAVAQQEGPKLVG